MSRKTAPSKLLGEPSSPVVPCLLSSLEYSPKPLAMVFFLVEANNPQLFVSIATVPLLSLSGKRGLYLLPPVSPPLLPWMSSAVKHLYPNLFCSQQSFQWSSMSQSVAHSRVNWTQLCSFSCYPFFFTYLSGHLTGHLVSSTDLENGNF